MFTTYCRAGVQFRQCVRKVNSNLGLTHAVFFFSSLKKRVNCTEIKINLTIIGLSYKLRWLEWHSMFYYIERFTSYIEFQ